MRYPGGSYDMPSVAVRAGFDQTFAAVTGSHGGSHRAGLILGNELAARMARRLRFVSHNEKPRFSE